MLENAFNDTQPSGAYPIATDGGPRMQHFNNSSINIRDKNAPLLTPLLAPTNYDHLGRGLLLFLPFRRRPLAEKRSHRLPSFVFAAQTSPLSGVLGLPSWDLPLSPPTDGHLGFYRLCCIIFGNLLRFAVFGTVFVLFCSNPSALTPLARKPLTRLRHPSLFGFSLSDSGVFCCVHAGALIETILSPSNKYLIKVYQIDFYTFPNVPLGPSRRTYARTVPWVRCAPSASVCCDKRKDRIIWTTKPQLLTQHHDSNNTIGLSCFFRTLQFPRSSSSEPTTDRCCGSHLQRTGVVN